MAEKNINEISRDARLLFTKANEAAQRENTDYAIALFNQVLEKEPAFYDCRKALRAAQFKKAGAGGGGFFKKMISGAGSSPQVAKAKMVLGKNPGEAMAIAEQILNGDPNNSSAHRIIVDAANALELPHTAVLSYETLVKSSPKDRNLAIDFAQALAAAGDVSENENNRGEKILMDLLRENPHDSDLNKALKNLSARKTMDQGGYSALEGGGGSFRDILKNKAEANSLEQQNRVVKTEDVTERLIGEYEARLQTEPDNLKLVRQLADLYTQKKQFDRALEFYDRIKKSGMGNDPSLETSIANTMARRFDHQIAQLNPFDADHAEQVAKIQAEKLDFQLAECQKRVEKFPTDLAIRFEMGTLYFQAGKFAEAIQELQKAQGNPHKRLAAMSLLAQCFAKRKMFDLAARTLQNAIKEKVVFDDEKKDLTYNLGCVLESMGKKEEAVEQFKIIYEMDIGYKDVAAKVDAFYAGQ
ncbi:MAG TPA: tetratricopeptide repeat protein [Verrucomicrobiae bacterium]|jgi:tetratricopeptide (TPR) repeat protein|nr:tetratricopeptide repeat protein [Verrucomicrobiae bacterium]